MPTKLKLILEKIRNYVRDSRKNDWKNRYLLCADDGNDSKHLTQMKDTESLLKKNGFGPTTYSTKYTSTPSTIINGKAPDARERMQRYLDQGVIWWYIGHASATSRTGEGLLELTDINVASYPHAPMLFAATCNFLRWDRIQTSGAEMLFLQSNGIIGAIAATRPVYIDYNKTMAFGVAQSSQSAPQFGNPLSIGEVFPPGQKHQSQQRPATNCAMCSWATRLFAGRYLGKAQLEAIDNTTTHEPDSHSASIMAQQRLTISGAYRVRQQREHRTLSSTGTYVTPQSRRRIQHHHTGSQYGGKRGVLVEGQTGKLIEEMWANAPVRRAAEIVDRRGEFEIQQLAMPIEDIRQLSSPATMNL